MGLPLYVSKSSNTDRDAKNKNCDKIPGPRRSIRRRARLNDLNREASSRLRQRRAFIATHLNDRNSEEDGGPPRDRPLTVERVDLGPIRARSARTPGSYIASILDSIHSGPTGGVDPGRGHEAEAEPFSISDALDRAQSMANISSMHDDIDTTLAEWRNYRSTNAPSRNAANRERTSAHTVSPWDLYVDGPSRYEERGATHIDGLGDRERSLSPDANGTWDTLLTTLTPDPQPPSAGSSFASATASNATSQGAAPPVPASQRPSRAPREPAEHQECGVCERCMIRRANRTALRSRAPPHPLLPLNDILMAQRRTQRNRFDPGGYHGPVTGGGAGLRQPADYLSVTFPDDDNSPGAEESSFDVWTRRQREASRRE